MANAEVAVLGAGAWGTALAILLARNGRATVLWGRNREQMAAMALARCNAHALPGQPFPETLQVTSQLATALANARDLLLVVPSNAFREVLQEVLRTTSREFRVAWGTKGFEQGTGQLLGEVVAEVAGGSVPAAVLSGPTFASEVAAGLPTAVTLASKNTRFAEELACQFHHERFRVYTSEDIVGVQVGGAMKNVLAIAAGIADGLDFGANTRAALITRGLAELVRLGVALGGRRETFMGLAGLGDLVLTCTDDQSRNRRLGLALAQGQSVKQALRRIGQAVEGVHSAREAARQARRLAVELPIGEQVSAVLEGMFGPEEAVHRLLRRSAGPEFR